MTLARTCAGTNEHGEPCRQAPLRDGQFCYWHSPEHAEDAKEARRLGGLRRRREHTLVGAYELDGLTSVAGLRRLLEVAAFDVLGLENSLGRARALVAIVLAGERLVQTGELEARVAELEATVHPRRARSR